MTDPRTGWLVGGIAATLVGALALFLFRLGGFELLLPGVLVGVASLTAALWMLRRSALPQLIAIAIVAGAAGLGLLWLGFFGVFLIVLAAISLGGWLLQRRRQSRL